jgi:hypothetical protein
VTFTVRQLTAGKPPTLTVQHRTLHEGVRKAATVTIPGVTIDGVLASAGVE